MKQFVILILFSLISNLSFAKSYQGRLKGEPRSEKGSCEMSIDEMGGGKFILTFVGGSEELSNISVIVADSENLNFNFSLQSNDATLKPQTRLSIIGSGEINNNKPKSFKMTVDGIHKFFGDDKSSIECVF